jgi:hypothetical protein
LILFENEEGAITTRKFTTIEWSGLTTRKFTTIEWSGLNLSFSRFSPNFDACDKGTIPRLA